MALAGWTRAALVVGATAVAVHTERVKLESLLSVAQMTLWLILGLVAFLVAKQDAILYIPHPDPSMSRAPDVTPRAYGQMPYQNVELTTSDGVRIHSWLILQSDADPAANRACNTLIYFHGNAGNIANRLPFYAMLYDDLKVNILAVDYRGYGSSEGEPSEAGLKEDARAVAKFAEDCEHIDPNRVFVFGRSLGGAVAIHLLASGVCDLNVRGLVVENTFLSVAEMGMVVYPFLKPLRPFLRPPFLRNEWLSRECIANIACPILFVSGGKDELIPPEQMRQLFRLSRRVPGTQFRLVPNGGHNDTPLHGGKEYTTTIGKFMEDIIGGVFEDQQASARRDTGASVDSILSEPDDFHHHIFS